MSDYESKASTPKRFEDVGRIKASEFYAFAGLFRQMPENVREIVVLSMMRSSREYARDAAGFDLMALGMAKELYALLEAIRE